jgi:hypothetical protein
MKRQIMSYRISTRPLRALAAVTALALSAISIAAQDSTTATTNPAANAPAPTAARQTAVQLSFGVPDVLKLSQAQVSEDTIIAYVQASGRSYGGMSASEIVYLHEQGVSDSVVNAMLNQGKQLTAAAAQTTQQASVTQATTEANATTSAAQSPQAYGPTPVTPAQPAPATVYVAPNAPPVVDYGYYPSYGYYYPPVSFSFGFVGGYRGGYYYGGGHSGYHGGGGYHGGYHGGGSHGGGGHR